MKYLLLLCSLLIVGCGVTGPEGPSGMDVVMPASYIEWEAEYPMDTTWWTFSADGTVYAAYKKKVTEVSGYGWEPTYKGIYHGETLYYRNANGEVIGTGGKTLAEYNKTTNITDKYLPIEYYKGTWGSNDGMMLTFSVNRVVPGNYSGYACDLRNAIWVTSLYEPQYITYEFWTTDSLFGYQSDEYGERIPLHHSSYNCTFSGWHGKHLFDKTNPIFQQ